MMVGLLAVASVSALAIAVAHHLGLVEKVSEVAGRICSCARCSVFWGVAAVLVLLGHPLLPSLAIALAYAYLTDWLGLLLFRLAVTYDELWKRLKRKTRKEKRKRNGRHLPRR